MTLATIAGAFNIIVGLMLVAAILLYGAGIILWFARLGTYPTYRDDAIQYMKWSVVVMFVLIALLVVVKLVQEYPQTTAFVIGVIFFAFMAWFIATSVANARNGEQDH